MQEFARYSHQIAKARGHSYSRKDGFYQYQYSSISRLLNSWSCKSAAMSKTLLSKVERDDRLLDKARRIS